MFEKSVIAVGALLLASVPVQSQFRNWENEIRVRGGIATPDGGGDYFDEKEFDFTGSAEDLEDAFFGVDYRRQLAGPLSLLVSLDGWQGTDRTQYREFEDTNGFPIRQEVALEVTAFTVGLQARLAPPRSPIVPYVGVGGGLYGYTLEEAGEFIDFSGEELEIFSGFFEDTGTGTGWYAQAGVEFGFGSGLTIFVEGRWTEADAELGGDFDGFGTLELSNRQIGGGVGFRF
jgi:opacity protein-like surface antigen